MNNHRLQSSPRVALVLSGGGARGAYEAGVLSYVFEDVARRLGHPVHFDIVTGTSVGAIHACYVAAAQEDGEATRRLTDLWRSLSLDRVYDLKVRYLLRGALQAVGIGARAKTLPRSGAGGPDRLAGFLDTTPLERLVLGRIPWGQLRRNVQGGRVHALAITATEIATGHCVVFVDSQGGTVPQWARDPLVVARAAQIRPEHALASAAIPLLFPAVRIGPGYYCDGGVRLNTPLAPALRLGAERVLIIGLSVPSTQAPDELAARRRELRYGSTTHLAGKLLDALLLDRIDYDVDRLRLFNALLESGMRVYGPDFLNTINEPVVASRKVPYRIVRHLFLRPSQDLGVMAADCFRHQPRHRTPRGWLSRWLARLAGGKADGEADLLSYLLFDRCYAEHLIQLGRRDAQAASDDLLEFFAD